MPGADGVQPSGTQLVPVLGDDGIEAAKHHREPVTHPDPAARGEEDAVRPICGDYVGP